VHRHFLWLKCYEHSLPKEILEVNLFRIGDRTFSYAEYDAIWCVLHSGGAPSDDAATTILFVPYGGSEIPRIHEAHHLRRLPMAQPGCKDLLPLFLRHTRMAGTRFALMAGTISTNPGFA
jgi:hypothetical protein